MYGTFPRVLGRYAREREAVLAGDGRPEDDRHAGHAAGLHDRGLVRAGQAADLTVFDPATVRDEATFEDPHRHPAGIPYVIINGAVVVDAGRMNAAGTGRVLTG